MSTSEPSIPADPSSTGPLLKQLEFWALVFAAVALVISILGWIDSHRLLTLSAGQLRAYLQVVDVNLSSPLDSANTVQLSVTLRNLGQTAAVQIEGEMDYAPGLPDTTGNPATRRSFPSMGPGMERRVALTSNKLQRTPWPVPRLRMYETIFFFGTFWYVDDTTGEERKEDYCFKLPLRRPADLVRRDLEICDDLHYSSSGGRR